MRTAALSAKRSRSVTTRLASLPASTVPRLPETPSRAAGAVVSAASADERGSPAAMNRRRFGSTSSGFTSSVAKAKGTSAAASRAGLASRAPMAAPRLASRSDVSSSRSA